MASAYSIRTAKEQLRSTLMSGWTSTQALFGVLVVAVLAAGNGGQGQDARAIVRERGTKQARRPVDVLIRQLLSGDTHLSRVMAAYELGNWGTQASAAVPALITALKGDNDAVRSAAASALGEVGPAAVAAGPALASALSDRDESLARSAGWALAELGPAVLDEVVTVSRSENQQARWIAAEALGQMKGAGTKAIRALQRGLKDHYSVVRMASALALAEKRKEAAPTAADLRALLTDTAAEVRVSAARALWRIDGRANDVVPVLAGAVQAQPTYARELALQTIGEIGIPAGAATEVVTKALGDRDATIRLSAALTIGRIAPPGVAVPGLIRLLKDEEEGVRSSAAAALGRMGPPAKEAVPALTAAGETNDGRVRIEATVAVARIIGKSTPAIELCTRMLGDGNFACRYLAARDLGIFGTAAKSAVPSLLQATKDANPLVATAALNALKRIDQVAAAKAESMRKDP